MSYGTFPDIWASNAEKDSISYGRQYLGAIVSQLQIGSNSGYFQSRSIEIRRNRLYASGRQDVQQYKDLLDMNGKRRYVNLDWKISSPLPKLIESLIGGYMRRDERVTCTNLDPTAGIAKEKKRAEAKAIYRNKPTLEAMEAAAGYEMIPNFVRSATDEEDIDLYFDVDGRTREEVFYEDGLNMLWQENGYRELKRRILKDIFEAGIGGTKTFYDDEGRVRIRAVKPERSVSSYSDLNTLDDITWAGEVVEMTIAELRKEAPHLTEREIYEVAKQVSNKYGNPRFDYNYDAHTITKPYDNFKVWVLDAEFVTMRSDKYEKKDTRFGNYSVHKRDDSYAPPPTPRYKREMMEDVYPALYGGKMVVGTDVVFDYGRKYTPFTDDGKVQLSYTFYFYNNEEFENKPPIEHLIPTIDNMQIVLYKIQHIVAKMRPKGLIINVNGLTGVNLGQGMEEMQPLELGEIYDQTGNMYYNGMDDSGDMMNRPPIVDAPPNLVGDINQLIGLYNFYLEKLREDSGMPRGRDATSLPAKQAVGVAQMMQQASENSTFYLYSAWHSIMERTSRKAAVLLNDAIKTKKEGYKLYARVLGSEDVKFMVLNMEETNIKYGIDIEMMPDDNEKQELNGYISIALDRQELTLEDAIRLRRIPNIKTAERYLISARRRKMERDMQIAQQNAQINAEQNMQATQAKFETDAGLENLKSKNKREEMMLEYELKAKLMMGEKELDSEREQFNMGMQAGMTAPVPEE